MPTPPTKEAAEVAAIIDQLPLEMREYLREMVIRVAGIVPLSPPPPSDTPTDIVH